MNKKLEYLQITRGLAAMIVVLHHITGSANFYLSFTPFGGIFKAGWNGVDFFFVLSGFIIYYIHSDDIGVPERFKRFTYKRFVRIYPVYWIVAVIALGLIIVANKHVSNARSLEIPYLVKSFFLIAQVKQPFLGVAWSLCFEVFFYLVFAIGILSGRRVLFCILAAYFMLLGYQTLYPGNNFYVVFFSSNFHLEFLFGIVTSAIYKAIIQNKTVYAGIRPYVPFILCTGIAFFAASWICTLRYDDYFNKFSIGSRIFYGISSGLIIMGVALLNGGKNTLAKRFFLLLGDASYVLYLLHPLVLAIFFKLIVKIHHTGNLFVYEVSLMAFVLSIAIGIVFHLLIEKNILSVLNKRAPNK